MSLPCVETGPHARRRLRSTRSLAAHGVLCGLLLAAAVLSGCASVAPQPVADEQSAPATRPATPHVDPAGSFAAALAAMQRDDWHSAVEQLQALTAQDPGYPGAWTNLGIARVALGDSAGAETALRQAVSVDPHQAEAWNQLGMLYRRSNRLQEARAAYQQALQAQPDHADAHWNLAVLLDRYLQEPAPALAEYSRYRALTQSDDASLQQWIVTLEQQLPAPENQTATTGGGK